MRHFHWDHSEQFKRNSSRHRKHRIIQKSILPKYQFEELSLWWLLLIYIINHIFKINKQSFIPMITHSAFYFTAKVSKVLFCLQLFKKYEKKKNSYRIKKFSHHYWMSLLLKGRSITFQLNINIYFFNIFFIINSITENYFSLSLYCILCKASLSIISPKARLSSVSHGNIYFNRHIISISPYHHYLNITFIFSLRSTYWLFNMSEISFPATYQLNTDS